MKKIAKNSIFLTILMILLIFSASFLFFSCGKKIPIESIEFANTFSKMYVGQTRYVGFNVYPADANDYRVTISSSDKSVKEMYMVLVMTLVLKSFTMKAKRLIHLN